MKKRCCLLLITAILFSLFCMSATADTLHPAGKVINTENGLNVRQSATASSKIVSWLPKNAVVMLLSQSGNWYKVQYGKSATGYCSASYINPITDSTVAYVSTAGGVLNVRSGAGTGYTIKTTLAKGTRVVQLSSSNAWSKILYNGKSVGYVSSKYLSSAGSTESVSLSVPRYRQTDSRWASVKLGNSSATIGKSGCATTCLAMVESYRLGQTVTPAMMAKKLSYTSGGSVYWPASYSQTTSSSNYLSFIYNKLKAGKPVILGLKTNAGGMHFVVVTGCSGSITSASSYSVNDPGTYSRTSLSQVLAVYPNFYKMLW